MPSKKPKPRTETTKAAALPLAVSNAAGSVKRSSAKRSTRPTAAKDAPSRPSRKPAPRPGEPVIFEMPERFQFQARGASMEVVDTQTNRRTAFPKAATGVIAKVLGGLFSEPVAAGQEPPGHWAEELPATWENQELGLVLTRGRVAVDPAHPNHILGRPEDHPEGHVVHAYVISLGGHDIGHVLAPARERFVLIAPALQSRHTQHRGFMPTTLRLEVLAKDFQATDERASA